MSLKFSELKDESLSSVIISGNPMHAYVQQSMKSFHISAVGLLLRNTAFWKLVGVSTTCRSGLLFNHIRSSATSLLKIMSSGWIVALNGSGGTEKVEQDLQL